MKNGGQMWQMSEKLYILKRRVKAFFYSLVFYVNRIYPIERNKIIFWTFEGSRGFCCNPQYIAEEILKRNQNDGSNWRLIWLVDDMYLEFPKGIEKIKNTLWNRAYQLSTAGFWVGNTRTFYGTKKRKGQIYIQTWHGTICIKPIGKYRGDLFPRIAYLVSKADSKLTDYVLSGCDWCDIHYRDGLVYDGKIIRTGTPRCDILMNSDRRLDMRGIIRRKYGVPNNSKILLYAPTFRGGSQNTRRNVAKEEADIDFKELIDALERRFEGEWYIFTRLHPQLAARNEHYCVDISSRKIIDVTFHLDMNELIAASDAFISDYSSAIFEAAILRMPCFIFADDLDEYIENRGDLFFDMNQLPFPIAQKNEELIRNILRFDLKNYVKNVDKFMEQQGVVEDGGASKRVADLIENSKKC